MDAAIEAKPVRRELARGTPSRGGLSKDEEQTYWDTITQVRADPAEVPRK